MSTTLHIYVCIYIFINGQPGCHRSFTSTLFSLSLFLKHTHTLGWLFIRSLLWFVSVWSVRDDELRVANQVSLLKHIVEYFVCRGQHPKIEVVTGPRQCPDTLLHTHTLAHLGESGIENTTQSWTGEQAVIDDDDDDDDDGSWSGVRSKRATDRQCCRKL